MISRIIKVKVRVINRTHTGNITPDLESPWQDYCIICSYNVTGADFENSLYAFGQSGKSLRVICIIKPNYLAGKTLFLAWWCNHMAQYIAPSVKYFASNKTNFYNFLNHIICLFKTHMMWKNTNTILSKTLAPSKLPSTMIVYKKSSHNLVSMKEGNPKWTESTGSQNKKKGISCLIVPFQM